MYNCYLNNHLILKKPDAFGKSRGVTLSEPVQIVKRHEYAYATDRSTRQGPIKMNMLGDS